MKILLLVPQNVIPADNGGKTSIYMPMRMLAQKHQVKAVVFCDTGEPFNEADYAAINVQATVAIVNKKDSLATAVLNIGNMQPFKFAKYYTAGHAKLIKDICSNWQPGVIICHHAHLALYCRGIKKQFPSIKLILREHNVEYLLVEQFYKQQKNVLLKAFARWQYKKTKQFEESCWNFFDTVAFISDSDFECFTGISRAQGVVMYDGAETVATVSQVAKKKAFLFTGSIKSYQNKFNLAYFIKNTWMPWKQQYPHADGYELWVTGDRDINTVRQALALTGAEEDNYNIKLLGFVDDILQPMRECTFFISPTLTGAGLRIKVLEAMAAGCVVFLTKTDEQMAAVIKDGVNAIVYDDVSSFNKQFERLLQNAGIYNNISAQAVKTAQHNFTWPVYLTKIESLLQ